MNLQKQSSSLAIEDQPRALGQLDLSELFRNGLKEDLAKEVAAYAAEKSVITVSEWAELRRYITASSIKGKYTWRDAPYQQGMMDAVHEPVHAVVYMIASQLGKTEVINNIIGYYMAEDPNPILVMYPTVPGAKAWSREKFQPMVDATPCLQELVPDVGREGKNTILFKQFPGGFLSIFGAQKPAGLAQRSAPILVADEVDRYPMSAGKEGDPLFLFHKRADSYRNAKHIISSTPTIEGASRIATWYEASDKRKFLVPCHKCHTFIELLWAQVIWNSEPHKAHYVCQHCDKPWTEEQRRASIMRGRWEASVETRLMSKPIAGFHLNWIYNVFPPKDPYLNRLHQAASEWTDAAKMGSGAKQVVINTGLAETYQDDEERIEVNVLVNRRKPFGALPNEIVYWTGGADLQKNRIVAEKLGWTADEETYGIEVKTFLGNPADISLWKAFDAWMRLPLQREDKVILKHGVVCVDCGYKGEFVRNYTRQRQTAGVFAVSGSSNEAAPAITRPRRYPGGVLVWTLGVNQIKDMVYSRLNLTEKGPGYCHFNGEDAGYTETHLKEICSEYPRVTFEKGRATRRFYCPPNTRNEGLDIRVYATAARIISGVDLKIVAKDLQPLKVSNTVGVNSPPPGTKKGFATSWRR